MKKAVFMTVSLVFIAASSAFAGSTSSNFGDSSDECQTGSAQPVDSSDSSSDTASVNPADLHNPDQK